MTENGNVPYVRTDEGLAALCESLADAKVLAVDTEFIRERTYWPRLCLIQIGDGDTSSLIDPLTIEEFGPLRRLFADPGIVKVLHAGEQDLEIFHKIFGEVPTPIFDTQVAAALASFPLQAGYGLLVEELLGVRLDKMDSYTDWARRPLSDRQLRYALDDVVYLPEVYRLLTERLRDAGRLDWLDADFDALSDPKTYEVVPEESYRRVKRRRRLRRRQMGVLLKLAAWREREAMRRDIPRARVLGDEALVQVAARTPSSPEELAGIRGVHEGVVKRDARKILAAVADGLAIPEDELPTVPKRTGKRLDVDAVTDLMSAVVRTRAREYGIAVPVLASRKQMEALAQGEREGNPLLAGWRRSHIGEELVDVVEGRLALSLDGERLVIDTVKEAE